MNVKTSPEVKPEGVQKIFDHLERITPESFKELVVFLQKEGYRISSVKTKRIFMPKVPIHRPVIMRVPVKVFANDDPRLKDVDMLFNVEEINEPREG